MLHDSPATTPDIRLVTSVQRGGIGHLDRMPFGAPWSSVFDWRLFTYSPDLIFGTLLALLIDWHASARHWFTGAKHTIDLPEADSDQAGSHVAR